ncbi:MAG: ComEC/Rec2 family competence protein [Lysobacterales bacterium]
MTSFNIEMLPAVQGDALWVEYSDGARTRRMLIDGGPLTGYEFLSECLTRLPDGDQRVELLVVSHVDTDHIEGIVRLLATPRNRWPIEPKDIWFNGYRHMGGQEVLGGREGEFLSALIHQRAFAEWNKAFDRSAVVVPDEGPLPRIPLAGGMVLTLLSPDSGKLKKMGDRWEKDVAKWEISPGDLDQAWAQLATVQKFHPGEELTLGGDDLTAKLQAQLKGHDPSDANGSSIAFLAEFSGKSCLFLADAHMDVVCRSIRRLLPVGQARLRVDAVKMSHHGSKNNITAEFLNLVDAEHFLFSSSGAIHDHPNREAVVAVIEGADRIPTLWFNYRSEFSELYEADSLIPGARYRTRYPARGTAGIVLRL